MQPNQDMQSVISAQNSNNMMQNGGNMMRNGGKSEEKMSKKQIVGMVILCLVAIAGVLFGIYGMNSQNEQVKELMTRATDAEEKVAKLETSKKSGSDGGTIEITDLNEGVTEAADSVSLRQNPIIKSNNPDEEYSFIFSSSVNNSLDKDNISIRIKDGDITECTVGHKEYTGTGGGYTITNMNNCNITGLNGKVYKVIGFWSGQMKMNDNIGFIMQDGTVQYFDFNNAVSNNDFSVKKANIDGFVVDAFDVGVDPTGSPMGGHVATVFILSDGSSVKYSEAML